MEVEHAMTDSSRIGLHLAFGRGIGRLGFSGPETRSFIGDSETRTRGSVAQTNLRFHESVDSDALELSNRLSSKRRGPESDEAFGVSCFTARGPDD